VRSTLSKAAFKSTYATHNLILISYQGFGEHKTEQLDVTDTHRNSNVTFDKLQLIAQTASPVTMEEY